MANVRDSSVREVLYALSSNSGTLDSFVLWNSLKHCRFELPGEVWPSFTSTMASAFMSLDDFVS